MKPSQRDKDIEFLMKTFGYTRAKAEQAVDLGCVPSGSKDTLRQTPQWMLDYWNKGGTNGR
jgi:hypothetical protein